MKAKKYIIYTLVILGLVFITSDVSFANLDSGDGDTLWGKFSSSIVNSLIVGMISFAITVLSYIIGTIAGALTFAALLLSSFMDMIFIKVPYIGDILGPSGDVAFVANVQIITSIVLLFSVFIWLFLGGFNYIKSVFDQITMGDQAGGKFNIIRDIILKFTVVLLVLSIPFSLPMFFKAVNTVSSGILKMEISSFDKEDQIIIASKPVTSLVELGLGLPAVEGLSSDYTENQSNNGENKEFVSIYNKNEGDGYKDGELLFSNVFNGIIDKSLFQFGRFTKLSDTITEKSSLGKIIESGSTEKASILSDAADGHERAFVIFLFISSLYLVLLYTIVVKLFALFMALVTRFVNILMSSIFLGFHIALLGSENTRGLGARNLWSFVGDILVTPLIAAFVGLAIIILGFFVSIIVGIGSNSFMYFGAGDQIDGYEGVLFSGMLIMAILWGMLNKLTQLVEYVGANFENIINTKNGGQGLKDSYANPNEAIAAAGKVWDMGKTGGKLLGTAAFGANTMKNKVGNMMKGKDNLENEELANELRRESKKEGVRMAMGEEMAEQSLNATQAYSKAKSKRHDTNIPD